MIPIARNRRLLLGALIGASLAQAALAAVIALCVQRVFDTLLGHNAAAGVPAIAGLIGAVFLVSAVTAAALETFRAWAGERLGLGYVGEIREHLFAAIMHASPAVLNQKGQGGLLLPFVGDLTAIKKWVSDGLVRLIAASATGVLLLGVLAQQSVLLAGAVSGVVLAAAIAVVWLSAPLNSAIRETRAKRGAVANFVASSINAAQTVQAFNRFAREAQRLQSRSDALMRASLRLATTTGAMTAIVHLAAAMLVGVTLIIGVVEVGRGAITIGAVAAAISIAALLAGAIRDLGTGFELWRRAKVSFAKVARALTLERSVLDIESPRKIRNVGDGVSLRGVTVKGVLENVSVEAKPGAVVLVQGESGAGKSTLLALAARMRDPDRGRVRVNGVDLRRAARSSLRRKIGLASATTPLMRGSIAMNLRYRAPGASEAEIARVIDVCNLGPTLDKFSEREQARLGDGARELSVGETQRLLIARAMVDRPPVLILDDVDSHLGVETVERIAAELKNYPGAVLMAATAPALRGIATAIWRIEGGGVSVEDGPGKFVEVLPPVAEAPSIG